MNDRVDQAAGGIAYLDVALPEPGEARPVAPGVWWVRMPLPFALDHINLWLLEDGDGWTLVDTGVARDEVRSAWRKLFSGVMAGRPVRRILVTHFHPDHFGLAGWLHAETGAPVWMTRTEWLTGNLVYHDVEANLSARQVAFFRGHGLDSERLDALAARGNSYRRLVCEPPPGYRRMVAGESISVGASQWRVVLGEGHAPEHACLHCESAGVLISGDQVLPRISPNVSLHAGESDSNPLAEYLASLERIGALPGDPVVLPSHDRPFRGLAVRTAELAAHHEERLVRLVEALAGGAASAADLLPVLFRRRLDAHQTMFAMGECLAHLVLLASRGRIHALAGDDEVTRWQAA